MRKKRKEKIVVDSKTETKKKHVLPGQVGTTWRILSSLFKPSFDHVSWLSSLSQFFFLESHVPSI
jgi:hypothetical protein